MKFGYLEHWTELYHFHQDHLLDNYQSSVV